MSEFDPYDFPYRRGDLDSWAPPLLKSWHPTLCETLHVTKNIVHSCEFNLKGKSVCVIGGGGSTNRFDFGEHDYYWSMNSFFKSERLRQLKLHLVGVGAGVDLNDAQFLEYVFVNQPILAFEIHPVWETKSYKHLNNKKVCYHTALYGRIGMGIRLVNLAAELGAETISFIGFDGPEAILKGDHAFEPGKRDLPSKVNEGNAHFIHKHQYDFCWKNLMNIYPFTKFISIDKENVYHECVRS